MSTALNTLSKKEMDAYQVEKLDALCSGVELLSQLVVIGDQNNPKLRGQLMQLSSAIATFESSMKLPRASSEHNCKEASTKQFRPILPTPKGKLLLIIERLKQASTSQRPTSSADNTDTDVVNEACCRDNVETGWVDTIGESVDPSKSPDKTYVECTKEKPSLFLAPSPSQSTRSQPPPFSQSSPSSQPPPSSQSAQPQQLKSVAKSMALLSPTPASVSSKLAAVTTPPRQVSKSSKVSRPVHPLEAFHTAPQHTATLQLESNPTAQSKKASTLLSEFPPSSNIIPPPPPLLPSSSEHFSSGYDSKKPTRLSPSVPLKPLFWKKVSHRPTHCGGADNIWLHVAEPTLSNMRMFVELFAKKEATPHKDTAQLAPNKSGPSTMRPVMLLEGRRSQAVSIMLHSLPCGVVELGEALRTGDLAVVDRETLQSLHDLQATKEELDLINSHLKLPDLAPLDKPEIFLHTLSEVPQFNERLLCLLYSQTLPESCASVLDELRVYSRLSQQLFHSTELSSILGLILALGNVMNSGNKVRGEARGFHLDILPKLRDAKTANRKSNLLRFIVAWYLRQTDSLQATLDLGFPLPDLADIMIAAKLDFDLLRTRVSEYSSKLDCFKTSLKKVLESSPTNLLYPFKKKMESHLLQFECDGRELSSQVDYCEKDFHSLVQYFCVTPPSGQSSVDPAYFFGIWNSFVMQFQEYWKLEEMDLARERLREEELKRRNEAVVKPLSSSGLKSRLMAKHFNSQRQ